MSIDLLNPGPASADLGNAIADLKLTLSTTDVTTPIRALVEQSVTSQSFDAQPALPAPAIVVPSEDPLQAQINWAWQRATRSLLMNRGQGRGFVEVDLGGREYEISRPLTFPNSGGGVLFKNGYLTAADNFPAGEFLLSSDRSAGTADQVDFSHILFNGRNIANLLRLDTAIRCGIDRCTFTGNRIFGLYLGTTGFELMCSRSYFFQSFEADPVPGTRAIHIENGVTDNHFTDNVERSNEIGVDSYAQANVFTNFHFYGKDYRMRRPDMGAAYGIKLNGNSANNRINQCQFDTAVRMYIENPSRTLVTNNRFCTPTGAPVNCIMLKAVTHGHKASMCEISGNIFDVPMGSVPIAIDPTSLVWGRVGGLNVEDNRARSPVRATRFNTSTMAQGADCGIFDISDRYLVGDMQRAALSAMPDANSPVATVCAGGLSVPPDVVGHWVRDPANRLVDFNGRANLQWRASDRVSGKIVGDFSFDEID